MRVEVWHRRRWRWWELGLVETVNGTKAQARPEHAAQKEHGRYTRCVGNKYPELGCTNDSPSAARHGHPATVYLRAVRNSCRLVRTSTLAITISTANCPPQHYPHQMLKTPAASRQNAALFCFFGRARSSRATSSSPVGSGNGDIWNHPPPSLQGIK